jgi:N-methylhydantoinase B
MESYYPVVVERYEPVMDTGGAGLHRGGCGIEKQYMFRRPGAFTINDDRAVLDPWGIGGGDSGGRSAKLLIRADGTREQLVSKLDNVPVQPGDRLLLYSDGFEQAFPGDPTGGRLSRAPSKRYLDEFAALRAATDPAAVVEQIGRRVDMQFGSVHQADDLTLVVVERGGTGPGGA